MAFRLADIYQDAKILEEASQAVRYWQEKEGQETLSALAFSSAVDFRSI